MTDHLTKASQMAISAHQDWQQAASSNDLPDSTNAALRARGNESWDEANEALRLHGLYALCDAEDQPGSLADLENFGMRQPSDFDIDLKPLDRLHARWQLIKFVNRSALVLLLLAVGFLAGYMQGQDAPHLTADQLSKIESQLSKLEAEHVK